MENWGLVTYRESCVLVDPANTSAATKQWVAIVVDHEMAHQWFGNLVTMEWYCLDAMYRVVHLFKDNLLLTSEQELCISIRS